MINAAFAILANPNLPLTLGRGGFGVSLSWLTRGKLVVGGVSDIDAASCKEKAKALQRGRRDIAEAEDRGGI